MQNPQQSSIDRIISPKYDSNSTKFVEDYSSKEYWESLYNKTRNREHTDWLCSLKELESILDRLLLQQNKCVLVSGCGQSPLPVQLLERYPTCRITAIDNASSAIERLRAQNWHLQQYVEFLDLDIRTNLTEVNSSSVDLIIDKSTIDSLFCGGDNAVLDVSKALKSFSRVLKPSGVLLIVSHGSPITRSRYFEAANFVINRVAVVDEEHHVYLYECAFDASSQVRNTTGLVA